MNLFDELVTKLLESNDGCEILSLNESEKIAKELFSKYPITWGRIDWIQVEKNALITTTDGIITKLNFYKKNENEPVYLIWGDASLPVIKCMLNDALYNLGAVKFLGGSATWLYCPAEKWVLEFHHDGDITLGLENEK